LQKTYEFNCRVIYDAKVWAHAITCGVLFAKKYTIPEQVACIAENATQSLVGHVCVTLFVLFELYGTSQFTGNESV